MAPAALDTVSPGLKKNSGAYFITQSNTNKRALIVRNANQGKSYQAPPARAGLIKNEPPRSRAPVQMDIGGNARSRD